MKVKPAESCNSIFLLDLQQCSAAWSQLYSTSARYMIGPSQKDLKSEQMTKVCDNDNVAILGTSRGR